MAGNWFGTGQPDDRSAMYLDHMTADGRIHSDFRTCHKGKAVDETEDGNWAVADGILTITVLTHDGVFMPRIDTYKIVSFDGQLLREIYQRLNFAYQSKKVDAGFKMPPCDLTS